MGLGIFETSTVPVGQNQSTSLGCLSQPCLIIFAWPRFFESKYAQMANELIFKNYVSMVVSIINDECLK